MARPSIFVIASLLSLGAPALADVVYLRDGRKLEGSITREGSTLVVRHRFGEARVQQSDVLKIVDTSDRWDELEKLRSELSQGTADERYRFAAFARDNDFPEEARRAFLDVLRVDIDHAGARAALGYVRHGDAWVTLEDKHRLEGKVEHQGEWITPEAKQAKIEAAREAHRELQEARRKEQEEAAAKKLERREREREERRERLHEYEKALARARARERAAWEADTPVVGRVYGGPRGVIVNGRYYPPTEGYGGVYGSPLTFSGGTCSPYGYGSYVNGARYYGGSGYRSGVRVKGSYDGGDWQLKWRLGY